ncbi:MAG: type II secretion system protein GspM [Planctomycetota bacterium]|jgi:hypothetical protein
MKSIYRKYIKMGISVWAGCFIVFLLSYVVVLAPQEKLKAQTESQFAEARRTALAAKEAAREENKIKLKEQAANLDERLQEFIIEEADTANLTFDIDRISNTIKLDSSSINTMGSQGIVEIENCEYLFARQINVDFASSFSKFAAFLNALERNRPVIFIDTFTITRARENNLSHSVSMKLAVLVGKDAKAGGVDG